MISYVIVPFNSKDKKTDRNTLLYLNICKWPRIAAPKSESDPIPIGGGSLYNIKDEKDGAFIYFLLSISITGGIKCFI